MLQHWEYKIVDDEIVGEMALNRLGDEGWELVSVIARSRNPIWRQFFFKRPLTDRIPKPELQPR
jgi:hypothetical protein